MAELVKIVFVVCLSFCIVRAKNEEYEGYTLYEVTAKTAEDGLFLTQLENELLIDIWLPPRPGQAGQVFVSKEYKEQFESTLTIAHVEFKATITNIKEQLDKEERELAASKKFATSSKSISFNEIPRYNAVNEYMDRLAQQYPNVVTVETAGRSIEGRDINYVKISTTNFQDHSKPIVFLQSLLHAREWVTLPAALYAIEQLVVNVTQSDLVNDIDWIIMPIANPDGYEWSHTNARFWRKNRARNFVGTTCMGVDLNRNFDIFWATASSVNPCSDTYHGTSAFSEPETQAIRTVLQQYSSRMQLYIDIHSFGSIILFGYGNGQLPPNALTLNFVGVGMAQAIDRVKWSWKPNYVVGNTYHLLYAASGGSSDYVQSIGVPLSYTYELPAYQNSSTINGFLVQPEFIEQAGFETWEGIKHGARYARDNYRTNRV